MGEGGGFLVKYKCSSCGEEVSGKVLRYVGGFPVIHECKKEGDSSPTHGKGRPEWIGDEEEGDSS